jgi:hypothetical protein
MEWQQISKNRFYIAHERWVFKKVIYPGFTTFQIWDQEEMIYNTKREFDFLKKYKQVVTKGFLKTGLY